MGTTYYYFQDRETLEKLFKHKALSSAIDMYGFRNSKILGASKESSTVYSADNSGPFPQPHPNSNVLPHNRVDHITHSLAFRGLTGPGLQPATRRFAKEMPRKFAEQGITEDWTEMGDFAQFFRHNLGPSGVQCIFGPTMLRLNPTFVQDIFEFDRLFPKFAPGLPYFMMPKNYDFRERLACQFKTWYQYARKHFDPSLIDADGDGDPIWGCAMMRSRQALLLKADKHDDDVLSHLDVGLSWATIVNVVVTTMFAVYHIFQDKDLLARVRHDLKEYLTGRSVQDVDPQKLARDVPLLSAIYAESMRVYIKVYSAYSSAHEDIDLGKWVLPKGALALVNSEPSHMDKTFWNTKNNMYPVETFWADRFMVNPSDPTSGPVNPDIWDRSMRFEKADTGGKPYFSMEGCQGSWIPYGGGFSMCPGRFLVKSIIILTCGFLAMEYDIEILTDSIEFTNYRYGMGVEDMKHPLPFRIRKRVVERTKIV
ncbi:Pfs, NACHT and ankyrin domain protein [Annulohypoxylon truncatum]|uniref:Pfs, NACHT and ankyrin domain protein n=1 Tax=Annulohypoxylon truncatum TaxID=327061 RepID=UPI0020076E91|nr:Pfs, NACHT and ankyrin domain protein [Annulohypoxylon truncatum]KAI1204974.1 Pfs, NACHT and ankyrin domain protein [Annulohypoxylon truncatum]